jgi:hypothetical protein
LKNIRKEKNPENYKHNKQLQQNDYPYLPAPFAHVPETLKIEAEYPCEYISFLLHQVSNIEKLTD